MMNAWSKRWTGKGGFRVNIVITSNNTAELAALSTTLQQVFPDCECRRFTDPLLAAKYAWNNAVDLMIVKERMRPVNCIELIKNIRSLKPELPVVILAEDEDMRERAEKLGADQYWVTPVSFEQWDSLREMMLSGS